jgi:hypothetical protein
MKIQIKPLTVNKAWRGGRRFKTAEYLQYEDELSMLLPKMDIPEGKLQVEYVFGLSNKASDYDNCIKQFQDIISKKYDFNDNKIYRAVISKEDVKKGEEFIEFYIGEYE